MIIAAKEFGAYAIGIEPREDLAKQAMKKVSEGNKVFFCSNRNVHHTEDCTKLSWKTEDLDP